MSAQPTIPAKEWRIVRDWHWLVTKSWSLRWTVLSAFFSGLEVWFTFFVDNPPLPRGVFAVLSSVTTVIAVSVRFLAQREES